jgi:hypothetical protein
MTENTIGYYLERVFRRLPDVEADRLSMATLTQLGEEGYTGIGYQGLYDALKTAHAHPDSERMQTEIWKTPHVDLSRFPWDWKAQHEQTIFGPNGERVILFPRRLVTTYQTKYTPSNFTLGLQEWEKLNFKDMIRGTDTRQIARFARQDPKVRAVYNEALSRKVNYGILLTLTTDSSTIHPEGRQLETEDGKIIPHIRRPKIIIPKATPEERKVLDDFCDQYQVPNKKLVDRLLGITD